MSEPNKRVNYDPKSEKELLTEADEQEKRELDERRDRVMTRIRHEHLENKVELKLDPMRTVLLAAGVEEWNTVDELAELIERVRKEVEPPEAAPQVASSASAETVVDHNDKAQLVVHSDGPQATTAENVPKTLEKVPAPLAGRVSDAVWTNLTLDERRALELYFIMYAMWVEFGYLKGRVSVLEAGRKVSVDASLPLADEVYSAYKASHDYKTFEKLLVDHNMDPKKIHEWTATAPSAPQAGGVLTPVVGDKLDQNTPHEPNLNTKSAVLPNTSPSTPTTAEKLAPKNENEASEVGLQTLMAFAPLDVFMKTLRIFTSFLGSQI